MNKLTDYVIRLKNHDSDAFRLIYEETYRDMYYLALKFMKNDADAEEVVQDAYIRAWNSIDTLQNPEVFRSWLSRIVSNTAKNALAKNSPLLFTEMEKEDDEGDVEEFDTADESKAGQPELSYDERETQDLVRQLIDTLSDEQRMCILMFHLEDMSISEIAETLSVSENTVKSRLNYGRKNIKKKAEELQKKGYRFYSIAPVWLLVLLLRREKSSWSFAQKAVSGMQSGEGVLLQKTGIETADAVNGTADRTAAGQTVSDTSAENSEASVNNEKADSAVKDSDDSVGSSEETAGTSESGNISSEKTAEETEPSVKSSGDSADFYKENTETPENGNTVSEGTAENTGIPESDPAAVSGTADAVKGTAEKIGKAAAAKAAKAGASAAGKKILGIAAGKFCAAVCAGVIAVGAVTAAFTVPKYLEQKEQERLEAEAAAAQAAYETKISGIEADLEAQCQALIDEYPYECTQYGTDENGDPQYTSGWYLWDMDGNGIKELLVMHMENSGRFYAPMMELYGFVIKDGSFTLCPFIQNNSGYGYFLPADGNGIFFDKISSSNYVSFWRINLVTEDNHVSISTGTSEGGGRIGSDELTAFIASNPAVVWNPLSEPVTEVAAREYITENMDGIEISEETPGEQENTEPEVTEPENTEPEEPSSEEALAEWKANAETEGKTVVTGTMRYVSYDELLQIQGKPDPNPGTADHSRMYLVMIFDAPVTLSCQSGDGSGLREKTATLICISKHEEYQSLDGQHVTAAIEASSFWWPSDTSLPLGEPSGSAFEVYSGT